MNEFDHVTAVFAIFTISISKSRQFSVQTGLYSGMFFSIRECLLYFPYQTNISNRPGAKVLHGLTTSSVDIEINSEISIGDGTIPIYS